MKYYYDLHVHTALSPCGDDDMTPLNIINMCLLKKLDFIAITDHNSIGNVKAVMEASQKNNGALVIAGMELETAEEIHVIILFPDIDRAIDFEKLVNQRRFKIKNKIEVYGHQRFMNCNDEIIGEYDELLVVSTGIGIYEVNDLAEQYGAVAIPAHVDKQSNGLIAILGQIDNDMGFNTLEVSKNASQNFISNLNDEGYRVLMDSDSHYLDTLNEREYNFLELECLGVEQIIQTLRDKYNTSRR